ncbi:endonuclease VII [Serratia phage BF]|uniref:Endonuclease VII n=1 Tax=Serratia phage BF TaxID=1962671 RepID=A0A1S6U9W3_9CAUD|nr:endonuclease VII [Serratia phage BF]AQW88528.1 hypothetical protein BF_0003 [Serratia phage BF]
MRYKKPEPVHIQGKCVIDGCDNLQAVVKKNKYGARCSKHLRESWQSNDPEIFKYLSIKRLYGLEKEDYIKLLESQDYKCYICGTHQDDSSREVLYVDHDHSTNKIRGLLCHHCNTGIGNFKDDPELLQRAIDYLKKNS